MKTAKIGTYFEGVGEPAPDWVALNAISIMSGLEAKHLESRSHDHRSATVRLWRDNIVADITVEIEEVRRYNSSGSMLFRLRLSDLLVEVADCDWPLELNGRVEPFEVCLNNNDFTGMYIASMTRRVSMEVVLDPPKK